MFILNFELNFRINIHNIYVKSFLYNLKFVFKYIFHLYVQFKKLKKNFLPILNKFFLYRI